MAQMAQRLNLAKEFKKSKEEFMKDISD